MTAAADREGRHVARRLRRGTDGLAAARPWLGRWRGADWGVRPGGALAGRRADTPLRRRERPPSVADPTGANDGGCAAGGGGVPDESSRWWWSGRVERKGVLLLYFFYVSRCSVAFITVTQMPIAHEGDISGAWGHDEQREGFLLFHMPVAGVRCICS